MTILIADDSPPIRGSLRRMLCSIPGIDCIAEASDGHEAESLIWSLKPEVLILDLQMPNRTGMETLQHISVDPATITDITIVVLTNYATPEVREQCRALGADYVLDKSMEFESILTIVKKAGRRI